MSATVDRVHLSSLFTTIDSLFSSRVFSDRIFRTVVATNRQLFAADSYLDAAVLYLPIAHWAFLCSHNDLRSFELVSQPKLLTTGRLAFDGDFRCQILAHL